MSFDEIQKEYFLHQRVFGVFPESMFFVYYSDAFLQQVTSGHWACDSLLMTSLRF